MVDFEALNKIVIGFEMELSGYHYVALGVIVHDEKLYVRFGNDLVRNIHVPLQKVLTLIEAQQSNSIA